MVEGAPGVPDQLSYTAEVSINYNFLCSFQFFKIYFQDKENGVAE